VSRTMRTPLLCKLRVRISPLEIVAGLLEGANICHVKSPWLYEPATIAASMVICRPKVIAAAPAFGPERSGGWRRRDFLGSRGMGEPRFRALARGSKARGRKS